MITNNELESQHKQSNTPIRSPVVDEERMRPGHWLGSVLCVPFSVLTLLHDGRDANEPVNKCSALAEMSDHLLFCHNRHGPRFGGCAPWGWSWVRI